MGKRWSLEKDAIIDENGTVVATRADLIMRARPRDAFGELKTPQPTEHYEKIT